MKYNKTPPVELARPLLVLSLFLSSCPALQAGPEVPVPPGASAPAKLVLWDGEQKPNGVGWVSPTSTNMAIKTEKGVGKANSTGIVFRMAHPNLYLESGWQWSTWAKVETTNLKPYTRLNISVKFTGPRLPNDLHLSLASPGDHKTTQRLSLKRYDAGILDGAWHDLSIPLSDFYTPDMPFDPVHAVQVIFGIWNDDKDFTVLLDDLTLERGKATP